MDSLLNTIVNGLLLNFLMFYLLKVSYAKMAICKTITFDNDPKNVLKDYHQSSFIFEENNSVKRHKKEIKTKSEREDKGEKSNIGQINQTEINQLKQEITGWIVLDIN